MQIYIQIVIVRNIFEQFIRDIFISDTNYVLLSVNGRFICRLLFIKPLGIFVVERIKDVVQRFVVSTPYNIII